MNNFILRSDINESVQNRTAAKLAFLKHEIDQHKILNSNLKKIVSLKQRFVEILTRKPANLFYNGTDQIDEAESKYTVEVAPGASRNEMLKELHSQNAAYHTFFKAISTQRNDAQSKALLNELVAEQVESYESDLLEEREESLAELRIIVQDKEYTVQEFEKQKPTAFTGGVLIKYKDIVTPKDQLIKMQNLDDTYQQARNILKKQINLLTELNAQATLQNEFASFELTKLKSAIRNARNRHSLKVSTPVSPTSTGNFELTHQKDSALYNNKPTPLEIAKLYEQYRKKIFKHNEPHQGFQSMSTQPPITNNAHQSYNSSHSIAANNSTQYNKKRVEEELERARKKFDAEILNEQILQDQQKQLENYNNQLMQTNEFILLSNQQHQAQIEKLQQNIQFYSEYHKKYMKVCDRTSGGRTTGGHHSPRSSKNLHSHHHHHPTSSIGSGLSILGEGASPIKIIHNPSKLALKPSHLTMTMNNHSELIAATDNQQQFQFNQLLFSQNQGAVGGRHETNISNNSADDANTSLIENNKHEYQKDFDFHSSWNMNQCKQFLKNLSEDFYTQLATNTTKPTNFILSRKIISAVSQNDRGIGFSQNKKNCNRPRSQSNLFEYKCPKNNRRDDDTNQEGDRMEKQIAQTEVAETEYNREVPSKSVHSFLFQKQNSKDQQSTYLSKISLVNKKESSDTVTEHQIYAGESSTTIKQQPKKQQGNITTSTSDQAVLKSTNFGSGQLKSKKDEIPVVDISTLLENEVNVSLELRKKDNHELLASQNNQIFNSNQITSKPPQPPHLIGTSSSLNPQKQRIKSAKQKKSQQFSSTSTNKPSKRTEEIRKFNDGQASFIADVDVLEVDILQQNNNQQNYTTNTTKSNLRIASSNIINN